ncbi:MAG: glycosyl hydrolase 115 family protein [Clostridia bacterium]|nr:glycosyl hydrolase 115 family protein [Clostridia bacterium]
MADFVLSLSTRIEAPRGRKPIDCAVGILRRDMRETLTKGGTDNVIRVALDDALPPERYTARVTEREILLTCGDDLGAVYALLSVSERGLGVQPLGWWIGLEPKKRECALIPCQSWQSPAYKVRFRCWFANDEVLFTGWHSDEAARVGVWRRLFETILRCGGNMVIAGTDREYDGRMLNDIALDMGLWLTQHHTELLGARMFARVYPDLQPSYTLYPDLFEGLWREAAEHYKGRRVVYAVGFRGQGDRAFWHDEGGFDTDEARGAMISRVIRRQMELVRAVSPDAVFATNLYGEMMALYRQGHLHIPPEVIRIWGDNGFGRMVSRRQNNHNPRTDAMPAADEPGQNGIYYHVSFYDLQAANHITMLQIPPQMIADELRAVLDRNGGTLWNVNVGSVKPHVFMLDLIRRMWTEGSYQADRAAKEFAETYLGCADAAPLLTGYAESAVHYGPHADDRAGDQYYHFPLRALARALLRGETDQAVPSLAWAAGLDSYRDQALRLARVAEPGIASWGRYEARCRQVIAGQGEDAATRMRETLLLPAVIHRAGCEGLYAFCQACVHALNEETLQAYLWTDRALRANREALAAMGQTRGRFAHVFDNDCFVGVGLTCQVLSGVRAWLRIRGDGELLYDWEKRYLIAPEETRVMLQTHRTAQLSDDELCLRLRGEVALVKAF